MIMPGAYSKKQKQARAELCQAQAYIMLDIAKVLKELVRKQSGLRHPNILGMFAAAGVETVISK